MHQVGVSQRVNRSMLGCAGLMQGNPEGNLNPRLQKRASETGPPSRPIGWLEEERQKRQLLAAILAAHMVANIRSQDPML